MGVEVQSYKTKKLYPCCIPLAMFNYTLKMFNIVSSVKCSFYWENKRYQ